MSQQEPVETLYDRSVVIDALNISNWESPGVYDSLHNGGVTAINATIAVWENYRECMDNVVAWLHRFQRDERLVQATSVRDILSAKEEGKVGVVLGWQNASPVGERPEPPCHVLCLGGACHPDHLQRAQPAGQRVLRTERRRPEQLWRGRSQGDKPAGYSH